MIGHVRVRAMFRVASILHRLAAAWLARKTLGVSGCIGVRVGTGTALWIAQQ